MVNLEYRNAYTEVLEILKYISKEDFSKIPSNLIKLFENNSNKNHIFSYNPNKTLQEQNVSITTKYIIAILFRDYWATPRQKEKIILKEKYDFNKLEEEKRDKYNPDNIFNTKQEEINETINQMQSIVEYKKETLWDKIKRIFQKNM